jgi:DNA-binding transcriptional LysR family regulator
MELRHLRYFVIVAEEGHVTRAAERLDMQQPPLSVQIKRLERELAVQLFRRKPRGVELTEAGHALLEDAREILARAERAVERTQRAARGEQGRISVGITPTSTYHPFVPQVIRSFREAFPLVLVTLEEFRSHELVDRLQHERIDVAFVRMPPANPSGIVVRPLLEEPMVLALPKAHDLVRRTRGRAISLLALADETFITYRSQHGFGLHAAPFEACQAAGFTPRCGQEAPRLTSMLNFVAIGLGISFVPDSLRHMHMDGVAYCPLKSPPRLTAPLSLASRRGDPSTVVRHFVNLARNEARRISSSGQ